MKKLALFLLLPVLALGQTGIQKDAAGNLTQSFGTGTKTITVSPGGQIYVGPGGILNIDTGADLRFQAGTIDWSSLTAYPTITTTAPLAGGGALSGGLTLSMPFASATQNGYLKSTDWVAFNTGALSFTTPLVNTAGTITIPVATGAANGYLASTDWTNFQAAYTNRITSATGTGPITVTLAANALTVGETQASSTGAGWLSAANWITFNAKQPAGSYLTGNQTVTLSGDATGSGATAITTTVSKINGVAYPSGPSTNTVPVVTGSNAVTYEVVPNAALANPSITIAGTPAPLGTGITLDTITGLSSTGLVKRTAANTLGIASGSDYQTPLSFTSPLVNTSGTVAMPAATASTNGYLKATDWVAFNTGALSFTSPLVNMSGTVSLPIASSIANGYLSSANWITFNGKQTAYTNLTTIGALADGNGWLHDNGYGTFSYSIPTETDPVVAGKTGIITASGGSISSITDNHTNWDAGYTYRVTGATGNSPITVSLAANALTVGETEASSTSGGYLSAADYANFAAGGTYRLVSATGTPPLTLTLSSNALTGGVTQASTSSNGYVSSTDWTNFQAGYSNRLTSATGSGGLSLTLSANALTGGLLSVPNSSLANSAITIAGTSTALGGTITQDTITGLSSTGLVKRTGANTLGIISDNGLVTNLAGLAPTVGLLESTSTGGAVAVLPLNTYLTSATGVSSVTGTSNEVIASGAHGDITLSTPQAIGTGSSPTFAGETITAALNNYSTLFLNGYTGYGAILKLGNGASYTSQIASNFNIGPGLELYAGGTTLGNLVAYFGGAQSSIYSSGTMVATFASGGTFKLYGASSGYVGFAAQSAAGSMTYTLPNADGSNNYVLTTDGSGNLSWSAKTGGTGGYITSINGDSSAAQTINATAPITISNAGAVHTIALATAIPFINVATYANLNAAIAALNSAGGGTLYLPAGTYNVTGTPTTITVPCTILGDGFDFTKIVQQTNTADCLDINTSYAVNITGILFNGAGGGTTSGSCVKLYSSGYFNAGSVISKCRFIGAAVGLDLSAASVVVRDDQFGCTTGARFDNTYNLDQGAGIITGCTTTSSTTGILAVADGLQIIGNSIMGGSYGIVQQVTNTHGLVDLWIEGNHIELESSAGISLQGPASSGGLMNVSIVGNEIAVTGCPAIDASSSACAGWLNNVTISGNVLGEYGTYGIKLYRAACVSITGNAFYGSGTAVYIDSSCSNGSVFSNTFSGGGTSITNNGGFATTTQDTSGNVTFGAAVAATSFNTTSSRRFKENIAPLDPEYSLAKVGQLRPVTFDWKPGQAKKGHDFGLIAEEVQEIFPQVVSRDEKGQINGLDYGKLSTVAISAIQQQQGEISGLRASLWSLGAVNVILLLWLALRRKP